MIEVLVWLLVVAPVTHHGGVPSVIDRFSSQEQCEHVRIAMPPASGRVYHSRCIQARILVQKGSAS